MIFERLSKFIQIYLRGLLFDLALWKKYNNLNAILDIFLLHCAPSTELKLVVMMMAVTR